MATKPPPAQLERHKVTEDGEVLGSTRFYAAVLPLSGIDFEQIDCPIFYVFAHTSKGGAKKGSMYSVKAVTAKGQLVLNGLSGTHDMGDYAMAWRMPFQPEANNDNA